VGEYAFYGTGGIAYVNGTGFTNDDPLYVAPRQTWLDRILTWKYSTWVMGALLVVFLIPTIYYSARRVQRCLAAQGHGGVTDESGSDSLALGTSRVGLMQNADLTLRAINMTEVGQRGPGVDWTCPWCTYLNKPTDVMCAVCRNYPDQEEAVVPLEDTGGEGVMIVY
jgi:hypothetical protein